MKQQLYMFTALRMGEEKEMFLPKMTAILKELNLTEDVLDCYPFELSGVCCNVVCLPVHCIISQTF